MEQLDVSIHSSQSRIAGDKLTQPAAIHILDSRQVDDQLTSAGVNGAGDMLSEPRIFIQGQVALEIQNYDIVDRPFDDVHPHDDSPFHALSASSICSSAALFVPPITSEIPPIKSFLAFFIIWLSRTESVLFSPNLVSDLTISARSNADPEVSSLKLSLARCFQSLSAPDGAFRRPNTFGMSDLFSSGLIPMVWALSTGTNNSPPLSSRSANW